MFSVIAMACPRACDEAVDVSMVPSVIALERLGVDRGVNVSIGTFRGNKSAVVDSEGEVEDADD